MSFSPHIDLSGAKIRPAYKNDSRTRSCIFKAFVGLSLKHFERKNMGPIDPSRGSNMFKPVAKKFQQHVHDGSTPAEKEDR